MSKTVLATVVALLAAQPYMAAEPGSWTAAFAPQPPAGLRPVLMQACLDDRCGATRFEWHGDNRGAPVESDLVLEVDGSRFSGSTGLVNLPFMCSIHSADLNGDGRPDYVVEFGGTGNGYAGEHRAFAFLLTQGDGYALQVVDNALSMPTWEVFRSGSTAVLMVARGASRLPDLPGGSVMGSDGRYHEFFVFDLLAVRKGAVALELHEAPEFPAWILYAFQPKHERTRLLPLAEQRKLWVTPLSGGTVKMRRDAR